MSHAQRSITSGTTSGRIRLGSMTAAGLAVSLLVGLPAPLAAQVCEGALGGVEGIWLGYVGDVGGGESVHGLRASVRPDGRLAAGIDVAVGGYDTGDTTPAALETRLGWIAREGPLGLCVHAAYRYLGFNYFERYGWHNGQVREGTSRLGIAVGGAIWSTESAAVHWWLSPEVAYRRYRRANRMLLPQPGLPLVREETQANLFGTAGSAGVGVRFGALALSGGVLRRPGTGVDALAFVALAVHFRR